MSWLGRAGVLMGGRMAFGWWRRRQREKQRAEHQSQRRAEREARRAARRSQAPPSP